MHFYVKRNYAFGKKKHKKTTKQKTTKEKQKQKNKQPKPGLEESKA